MNLKELSKSLGLSQTTVSRALNGYPEVKEETRARVVEAAREHNYRPNLRARSLATGRAQAIGHVLPISTRHELVNPIFADFVAGAGEIYTLSGYEMLLSVVPDDDESATYSNLQARGAVDGVVLHSPVMAEPRIGLLRDLGLPFVVHGRASDVACGYDFVDVDNHRAFHRATSFLLALGHRRIGLVNGIESFDFAHRRRRGYLDALAEAGQRTGPELMASGEMTEQFGYRTAAQQLRLPDPPSAFVVASIITAMGVRRAVEEQGLTLGRDVSVVTFDDELSYLANSGEVPMFTAMRSSIRTAGRQVAEMLLRRIDTPQLPPQGLLLEADLVIGRSTARRPESAGA